jgi:hypothetical protein
MLGDWETLIYSDIFGSIIVDYLVDDHYMKFILFTDTCKTLRKYKFLYRMKINKHF